MSVQPITLKSLNTDNPRWCVGCGDFGILMGMKRFMVDQQLAPHLTVNVSGIGCSGRAPNYINTYGVHAIHGRPITVALGLALARPDAILILSRLTPRPGSPFGAFLRRLSTPRSSARTARVNGLPGCPQGRVTATTAPRA